MKILVAGSNKDGNLIAKEQAIAILKSGGHDVYHTRSIYQREETSLAGNESVEKVLRKCDYFYMICSNGLIGNVTTIRLGIAYCYPSLKTVSSQLLSDPDLQYFVDAVCAPFELVEYLKLIELAKLAK